MTFLGRLRRQLVRQICPQAACELESEAIVLQRAAERIALVEQRDDVAERCRGERFSGIAAFEVAERGLVGRFEIVAIAEHLAAEPAQHSLAGARESEVSVEMEEGPAEDGIDCGLPEVVCRSGALGRLSGAASR